jgi:hypothetical protein
MKAPKERNIIACGNATGGRFQLIHQALKGRNNYFALSGLQHFIYQLTQGCALGYYISPLRGFFYQLLF